MMYSPCHSATFRTAVNCATHFLARQQAGWQRQWCRCCWRLSSRRAALGRFLSPLNDTIKHCFRGTNPAIAFRACCCDGFICLVLHREHWGFTPQLLAARDAPRCEAAFAFLRAARIHINYDRRIQLLCQLAVPLYRFRWRARSRLGASTSLLPRLPRPLLL